MPTRPRTMVVTAIVATAMISGCSAVTNRATQSSSEASSADVTATRITDATTPPPQPLPSYVRKLPIGPVSLALKDKSGVGTILVDGTGNTLYAFDLDTDSQSHCYDACADTWLPVLADAPPTGGIGIDDAATGTIARRDGTRQATYRGHPLYRYAGDAIDTDVKGQGFDLFGGGWHVLDRDGQPLA